MVTKQFLTYVVARSRKNIREEMVFTQSDGAAKRASDHWQHCATFKSTDTPDIQNVAFFTGHPVRRENNPSYSTLRSHRRPGCPDSRCKKYRKDLSTCLV